ncbi:MAG: hypothetical protein R3240_10925 [Gammaproteobacteria bacterium]|nr:hypothetical protein [Gammaproteobacteria bacterium]
MVLADNTVLSNLGFLVIEGETFHLGSWAIPLTIFATVGVINAVNMTDGLDGLAGGLSLVTLASVTIMFAITGIADIYFVVPLFSMSAILAFLMFNYRTPWLKKAKVFMGNGGSMLLGIILAWLLIKFSQGQHAAYSPVIALWIFAVPLMDTVCIMLRRVKHGKSPFAADREHLHHIFIKLGFSVQHSVALVISIATLCAIFGMTAAMYGAQDNFMFFTFLLVFATYFYTMEKSWKKLNNENHIIITGGLDNGFAKPLKRDKHV